MARILPVPDQSVGVQALPVPYEHPYATPGAQGAAYGDVAEQAAGVAEAYARDAKQKADAAAVIGAAGKAKAALNTFILDPEQGYASLRGSDAMAGRAPALDKFGKALGEVSSGLTADQQRMFAPHALTIQEQAFAHVVQHETLEQERYSQAQFRGNVDQTMVIAENPAVVASPAALREQYDSLFQTGIAEARRRFGQNASKDAIASVLVPELQKAALGTMNAAVASQDPAVAKAAYDQVGKYLVTDHQRFYAGVVDKLVTQKQVAQQTGALLRYAATSVAMPDGDPIARVDGAKLSAALAALPEDTPHLAEITRSAEQQEQQHAKVWSGAVGTVYQRVESAALQGGPFDLSRPGVSAQDLEWLRVNAPGELIKLRREEGKVDSAEAKAASADARSDLMADMANPGRRDFYMNLTVPEFTKLTVDNGLGPQDRDKARTTFLAILKGGQEEKTNRLVAEQLASALPTQKQQRDKLQGPLHDKTSEFIESWKAQTQGKGPKDDEIRIFINRELVNVKVPGTGLIFNDRMRRVLFETNPAMAGRTAVPVDTDIPAPAPATVRAATPAAAPAQPTLYRYSPDRKRRVPVDASGKQLGPIEDVP
jgi:hypothetical protein